MLKVVLFRFVLCAFRSELLKTWEKVLEKIFLFHHSDVIKLKFKDLQDAKYS